MRLRTLAFAPFVALVVMWAVAEGGPRIVADQSTNGLVGALPAPVPGPAALVAICNGKTDAEEDDCATGCGKQPYKIPKPTATGGVLTTLWDFDQKVCKSDQVGCPRFARSYKKTPDNCTEAHAK